MASQKVLIVDDSKVIRMQVKDMLPKGNFEVLEAGDGMEGLEIIKQENLSLILIDFFMPRMNGWEVVQKLQDHPRLKTIPVVMMSGRREDVEQTVPDQFSYFEFVGKPFEQPMLVQAIKSAMAKARTRQQPGQTPTGQTHPKAASAVLSSNPSLASATGTAATSSNPATTSPSGNSSDLQALTLEVQALRQENTQLRTEVEGLKKQVAQIMAFIRQKLK